MTRKQLLKSKEYWITQMKIKLWEATKGVTQKELAKRIGVTQPYISQLVNGDKNPSIEIYVKILLACGKVPIIRMENLKDQK